MGWFHGKGRRGCGVAWNGSTVKRALSSLVQQVESARSRCATHWTCVRGRHFGKCTVRRPTCNQLVEMKMLLLLPLQQPAPISMWQKTIPNRKKEWRSRQQIARKEIKEETVVLFKPKIEVALFLPSPFYIGIYLVWSFHSNVSPHPSPNVAWPRIPEILNNPGHLHYQNTVCEFNYLVHISREKHQKSLVDTLNLTLMLR